MAKLNQAKITWQAPTENEDGSAIDYELGYELYVDGEASATFPGRLNPDGTYEQEVSTLFPDTVYASYTVQLKAFRIDQPDLKSGLSNAVVLSYDKRKPKPPFLTE